MLISHGYIIIVTITMIVIFRITSLEKSKTDPSLSYCMVFLKEYLVVNLARDSQLTKHCVSLHGSFNLFAYLVVVPQINYSKCQEP